VTEQEREEVTEEELESISADISVTSCQKKIKTLTCQLLAGKKKSSALEDQLKIALQKNSKMEKEAERVQKKNEDDIKVIKKFFLDKLKKIGGSFSKKRKIEEDNEKKNEQNKRQKSQTYEEAGKEHSFTTRMTVVNITIHVSSQSLGITIGDKDGKTIMIEKKVASSEQFGVCPEIKAANIPLGACLSFINGTKIVSVAQAAQIIRNSPRPIAICFEFANSASAPGKE